MSKINDEANELNLVKLLQWGVIGSRQDSDTAKHTKGCRKGEWNCKVLRSHILLSVTGAPRFDDVLSGKHEATSVGRCRVHHQSKTQEETQKAD
jgi:hypothetical protein